MLGTKHYILTVVLLCSTTNCFRNFKAYFPRSSNSTYPRLVFGNLPTLNEFTLCTWIRLFALGDRAPHIFTYATSGTNDDIAVFLISKNGCNMGILQVKDDYGVYNCCFVDWDKQSWHHICTSWLSADGSSKFFIDGQQCSIRGNRSTSISSGKPVLGGGVAIIGQDQDGVGKGFDEEQAWYGDITNVNLWRQMLNDDQILDSGKCIDKKSGNVIAWSKTPMDAYDGVVVGTSELCKP